LPVHAGCACGVWPAHLFSFPWSSSASGCDPVESAGVLAVQGFESFFLCAKEGESAIVTAAAGGPAEPASRLEEHQSVLAFRTEAVSQVVRLLPAVAPLADGVLRVGASPLPVGPHALQGRSNGTVRLFTHLSTPGSGAARREYALTRPRSTTESRRL